MQVRDDDDSTDNDNTDEYLEHYDFVVTCVAQQANFPAAAAT